MSSEDKIPLLAHFRFGSGRCPKCLYRTAQASRRTGQVVRQVVWLGFRPVKCPKCSYPFFKWSLFPLENGAAKRSDERPYEAREPFELPHIRGAAILKNLVIVVLLLALCYSWLTPGGHAAKQPVIPTANPLPLDLVEKASRSFLAMECANRGFLLTGDQSYRDSFNLERDRFSDSYKTMLARSKSDPGRQEDLHNIKDKFTRWFRLYNPMIQHRRDEPEYKPNKDALLKCRLLHEEIMGDLANLNSAVE